MRTPEEAQLRAILLQILRNEVTRQAAANRLQLLINELEALPEQSLYRPLAAFQRPSVTERVGEESEVNQSPC
ncbi:hypothetical protein [Escherichia coli]|uniref:hypothetical protein n=1 Tax=Escherichia coli TaxID=562 RepID=UPI00202F346F|nr:hypothetical protein [Escherichia coli]